MTGMRILALSFAAALACGCSEEVQTEKRAAGAALPPNPLEITAGGNLIDRVKVGAPNWSTVAASQTVAARIEVDATRVTRVGTPVLGRITQLTVHEGQAVRRGELLALLNSTALSDAQLGFLKALSQRQLDQRALDRAQLLLKADVIGAAELQRREADLVQAIAELDAARDQLELMGMATEAIDELEKTRTINSVARIVASMDGTVLDRKLTLGQVIQPADQAFEIADLSQLWLVADVPEQNAGQLSEGTLVDAEVSALPGLKIEGTLSFVSPIVNPETRTIRVRMDLPNPNRKFKPSMLATVTLRDQASRQQVIPAAAVIREGDVEHVFVALDEDTFVLRPVKLGDEIDGNRVLLGGLGASEKIVVEGAFHLNNERRRQLLRSSEDA